MSVSLEDFVEAENAKPKSTPMARWFDKYPTLREQTERGTQKYGASIVYRWLKDQWGFPFSRAQFTKVFAGG